MLLRVTTVHKGLALDIPDHVDPSFQNNTGFGSLVAESR